MGKPRGAASVVIVSPEGNILLVPDGSFFQLPGGKIRENEFPRDAAVRETAEEVGKWIDLASLEPLCKTRFLQKGKQRTHHFFLYRMNKEEVMLPPVGANTPTPFWMPIQQAKNRKNFRCWHYRIAINTAQTTLKEKVEV